MSGTAPRSGKKQRRTPDALSRQVGARVKQLRQELDWSFYALVGETELAQGVVSEIERGLVLPRLSTLARIAAAFEVTVADLVLGDSLREQVFAATRGLAEADLRAILAHAEKLRSLRVK
jgi:transcriptional regulator with XRE-family HTH domain